MVDTITVAVGTNAAAGTADSVVVVDTVAGDSCSVLVIEYSVLVIVVVVVDTVGVAVLVIVDNTDSDSGNGVETVGLGTAD